ncbi:MAG: carbohydrate kinase [Sediminicola sp.]
MKKVYCIGELLIDFVAEKQGSDLSKANVFTKKAGGAPANVACAIAKLGGESAFVGSVGKDPFGTFLLDILEEHQVDISFVQRSKTFTTLAFVSLAGDGERDFVFSRGADRELSYDPGLKEHFKGNILHFGAATALLGGHLEEAYKHYFFDALSKEAFICFDPNFRADLWKGNEGEFIKKCLPFIEKSDLCKFSLEEAKLLSGKGDLEAACNFLHNVGAKALTITLGGEGTFVSTPIAKTQVPSIKVVPVDTTGAGDAFIGCLLQQLSLLENTGRLLEDMGLFTSFVAVANRAGAITTTNYGAIPALPSAGDLDVI